MTSKLFSIQIPSLDNDLDDDDNDMNNNNNNNNNDNNNEIKTDLDSDGDNQMQNINNADYDVKIASSQYIIEGCFHGTWKSNDCRYSADWLFHKDARDLFLCVVSKIDITNTHPYLLTSPLTRMKGIDGQEVYISDLKVNLPDYPTLRHYGVISGNIKNGRIQIIYPQISKTQQFGTTVLFIQVCNYFLFLL